MNMWLVFNCNYLILTSLQFCYNQQTTKLEKSDMRRKEETSCGSVVPTWSHGSTSIQVFKGTYLFVPVYPGIL